MPAEEKKISELLLDGSNPRIASTESQRDILRELIRDQGDKIAALAESIVQMGLNPSERLLVMESEETKGRFIVLEGNRRLAALRILSTPSILSGLEVPLPLKKRLESIAANFVKKKVEPIQVFVVPNREAAANWISLKHTGENGGRGTVAWSGVATARFRGADPALQVIEFIKDHGQLTSAERAQVEDINFPITTLQRLIDAKHVRQRLGFEVLNKRVVCTLETAETLKALRRVVLDIASKRVTVSHLKNKTEQQAYLDTFGADAPDLSQQRNEPIRLEEVDEVKPAIPQPSPRKPRARATSPSKPPPKELRKTLVPKSCSLHIATTIKASDILYELRTLKLDETPHSIAVMLRVFFELSVDHYLLENGLSTTFTEPKGGKVVEKKLKAKAEEVIADLVAKSKSKEKDFIGVKNGLSKAGSPLSLDLLHAYVHNLFVVPLPSDLTASWDNVQPMLELIWK